MSNVPTGMKSFDLDLAKQGHPICTRDGRKAKFIAHVPEALECDRLIVLVDSSVYNCRENGSWRVDNEPIDLFLAPLGYVEGKPVFAGDVVLCRGQEFSPPIGYSGSWDDLTWSKQKHVVLTRMADSDLYNVFLLRNEGELEAIKRVANAAIARSIADGDCIPSGCVEELMCKVFNDHYFRQTCDFSSFKDFASKVLKEYKEGLK